MFHALFHPPKHLPIVGGPVGPSSAPHLNETQELSTIAAGLLHAVCDLDAWDFVDGEQHLDLWFIYG